MAENAPQNTAPHHNTGAIVAIEQLLRRYCRGIDRCDLECLLSVWADGATVDYGNGPSDAKEWSRGVIDRLKAWDRTSHVAANTIVEFDEAGAHSETGVIAYHLADRGTGGAASAHWMLAAGRYLDRLQCIDGAWRITRRTYVMDWNETGLSNCELGYGRFERFGNIGTRWPYDLLYR